MGKDTVDRIPILGEILLGKNLASEAQLETITVLKNSANGYRCMYVALYAFVCVLAFIVRHCHGLKSNFTPCALLTVIATWY